MSNSSNSYYPFGPSPGNPYQAFLPYDLQISEVDPGIILAPTEANGVYFVMREVNGCVWQVLNADYSVADARWEQFVDPNSLINAALPAYAMEFCASGTVNRYTAVATIIPGNPVNWVLVWSLDANGNMTTSPLVGTGAGQISQDIMLTWNAGSPTVMSAREINLTDTSSNASSWLDNLIVNGTPKWQVRKDGTLVTGIVPYANISGAPAIPSFNNPTFTGTATFTGPAVFEDGLTVTAGTSTFDGPVVASDGLTVTGGETVDTLAVTGNETVGGSLNVTGNVEAANYDNPSGVPITGIGAFTTSNIILPAYQSTVSVPVSATRAFTEGMLVIIAGTDGTNPQAVVGFVNNVFSGTSLTTLSITTTFSPINSLAGATINTGATIAPYSTFSAVAIANSVGFNGVPGITPTGTQTVTTHFGPNQARANGGFYCVFLYSPTAFTLNSTSINNGGTVSASSASSSSFVMLYGSTGVGTAQTTFTFNVTGSAGVSYVILSSQQ